MELRLRIVEDTPEIATWLAQSLELIAPDMKVTTTTRNFDRLLTPGPWRDMDAAVVDLMLPGMSGLSILAYLAQNHPGIRRVAMTAALPMAEDATGLAHTVLVKPFDVAALRRALEFD